MKVLVVGSGAREHALAWRLVQSPGLPELHAAPGNPGIAGLGRCHPVRADDGDGLLSLALTVEADLAVIGPEAPLVEGVADLLRQNGVAVFGPSAAAARIEGSKSFAKDVLRAACVPTAETLSVARAPCVIKADGLASGKGVFVCHTAEEVDAALVAVAALGEEFVIEELLDGPEVSLFALCDGRRCVPIGAAQDFKRIGDGDTGPNTATPFCRSRSATPATSGASGPITARSASTVSARLRSPSPSSARTGWQRPRLAMPGLPGAACSSVSAGLCASRHASACSRAPEPTTSTFTRASLLRVFDGERIRGTSCSCRNRDSTSTSG